MSETRTPAEEPAHDVLAAEAFAMPGADPELHHHGPLRVPDDPTGIAEPHDVLAAEEFPMPAPRAGGAAMLVRRTGSRSRIGVAVAAVFLLMVLRRRARTRAGARAAV